MRTMIDKQDWHAFLGDFSRRNAGRPTRLGVFSPSCGNIADYWLEDGLPLVGADASIRPDMCDIELMFGGFTHSIGNVSRLDNIENGPSEEGLDITDRDGTTTVLRFEEGRIRPV